MKNIKTYEEYNEKNLKEFALNYAKEWYFNKEDLDKSINNINDFFNLSFPYGIKNLPKTVTLYRIFGIPNDDYKIDYDNFGYSYISDPTIINDDFLLSIGFNDDEINSYDFITIEINTPSDNIDMKSTIKNRIQRPDEQEFTIKNSKNIEIKYEN